MTSYLKYKNIYFLGIGGVGMSGLAGWLNEHNFHISGYDKKKSLFTKQLKLKGIKIQHTTSLKSLPSSFLDPHQTLIVYTPAIKKSHKLLSFFISHHFCIIKRSDILSQVARNYQVIAIAGTHGKTTISVMLSNILNHAGYKPNAFFGGMSNNFGSNFLKNDGNFMIIEADEYDRSFLKLSPLISIISSIDNDHGDTYDSYDEMMDAYCSFIIKTVNYSSNNTSNGSVFMNNNVIKKILAYMNSNHFDVIKHTDLSKIIYKNVIKDLDFHIDWSNINVFSDHNIQNAVSAIFVARHIGISKNEIINSFSNYCGVKRRFEYHINTNKNILIDDYAHHPVEIETLIQSVHKLYPQKKIFFIFQPHLFSRTRDLHDEFCRVLGLVDYLALLEIYPAREEPIEGVSSQNLIDKIELKNKWLVDKNNIISILDTVSPNLIITAGAGNVNMLIPDIKSFLT